MQATILGLVFLAGLVFRLIVCAEGIAASVEDMPPRNRPPPRDAALPFYAILVP